MSELPAIKLPKANVGDTVSITSEETGQAWDLVSANESQNLYRFRAATAGVTVPPPVDPPPVEPPPVVTPPPAVPALWIAPAVLMALPTTVPAFTALRDLAVTPESGWGNPITDQDSPRSRTTMAAALVAARLNDATLRGRVRDSIKRTIGQDDASRPNALLEWGRNVPGFVIAADLIGLKTFDATTDTAFRAWLKALLSKVTVSALKTVENACGHIKFPYYGDAANWGAYDAALCSAIRSYIGDTAGLAECYRNAKGFAGDRSQLVFQTLLDHDGSWQASTDKNTWIPVNAKGTTKAGHVIDGVIAQDQQRAGSFAWPPAYTSYQRESVVGRTVWFEILYNAGYTDVYSLGDGVLLRSARRLKEWDAMNGSWYEPNMNCYYVLRKRYAATDLPVAAPTTGRCVTGTEWTHA